MGKPDARVTVSYVVAGVYREPAILSFYRIFLAYLEAVFRFTFWKSLFLIGLLQLASLNTQAEEINYAQSFY